MLLSNNIEAVVVHKRVTVNSTKFFLSCSFTLFLAYSKMVSRWKLVLRYSVPHLTLNFRDIANFVLAAERRNANIDSHEWESNP